MASIADRSRRGEVVSSAVKLELRLRGEFLTLAYGEAEHEFPHEDRDLQRLVPMDHAEELVVFFKEPG